MSIGFDIAEGLRACLEVALSERPEPPAETGHRPGIEAPLNAGLTQDECCSGLGWVRIDNIEPYRNVQDATPCDTSRFLVTVELGVARCAPFGTQQRGPTAEQWAELALQMDSDAAAMRQAACCYAAESEDDGRILAVVADTWRPLDISGGCGGGTQLVVIDASCKDC